MGNLAAVPCGVVDTDSVFSASAVERRAVADLIEGLDEVQLGTASLCAGWDVRTVAGHLAAAAVAPSRKAFLVAVLRSGGNLHRANSVVARREAQRPVADLARTLRSNADHRFAPPVVGARGPLTDLLVHAGDMRIPLGLAHEPDPAHLRIALEFITLGRPVGFVPRGRLKGLRLTADDLDWSWGDGAELGGRGIDLLMAACGRTALLARLHGPGVEILRGRLGADSPA